MKVIKKPLPMKGVCTCCKAEYLIQPKELKKAFVSFTRTVWVKCKFCKQQEVKVVINQ